MSKRSGHRSNLVKAHERKCPKLRRFLLIGAGTFLLGWIVGHEHIWECFFVACLDLLSHEIIG